MIGSVSPAPARGRRASHALCLALLLGLCLAVVLGFGNLSQPGLATGDEALTALRSIGLMEQGRGWTPFWNGAPDLHKPPLYYMLVATCYRLLGIGETAVRLPSVLALLALLGCAFHLGRRGGGTPWAGLASAGLMASHPLLLAQSRVGMLDTTMCLFAALAACALLAAARDSRWYYAWGAGVSGALLTKGDTTFSLLVAPLLLLLHRRDAFTCRRFYGGLAVAVLPAAVWFGWHAVSYSLPFFRHGVGEVTGLRMNHSLLQSFLRQETTLTLWRSWGALAPLACGAVLLAPLAARRSSEGHLHVTTWALTAALVPLALICCVRQQMHWYCLPMVLPLAVLTAVLLTRHARQPGSRLLAFAIPALLLAGTFLPRVFADGVQPAIIWTARGLALTALVAGCAGRTRPHGSRLALATAVAVAIAPASASVRLHAPRDAAPFRELARLLPAGTAPVVVNFRHYPQNCLMFYSRRDTVQLRSWARQPVQPGGRADAVLQGEGFGALLHDLRRTRLATVGDYRVLSLSNATHAVVRPDGGHSAGPAALTDSGG